MTDLIYIGGYGRSGSTLLESLLTTRPSVLACGEVVSCLRDRLDRGCTCGEARKDCVIWAPFDETLNETGGTTHAALTLALLDRASGRFDLMVDSSKTAWGSLTAPFQLRRRLGERFHLIHVVRDPHGVCWSNAGGTHKRGVVRFPLLRHLRTVVGWSAANLSCELFNLLYPAQYCRVRYEDFTSDHARILDALFASLPQGQAGGAQTNNRHQLYGNHNRYKAFARETIREDVRWKMQMPSCQQAVVSVLTWPLRLRYGY